MFSANLVSSVVISLQERVCRTDLTAVLLDAWTELLFIYLFVFF